MAKSLLEELLIEAGTLNEDTEKRVNKKENIQFSMAEAVQSFINEAMADEEEETEEVEDSEDAGDYEEEDVDAETGEALEGEDEEFEDDSEEMEDDEEFEVEDSEDEEMGDDEEFELDDEEMEDSEEEDFDSEEMEMDDMDDEGSMEFEGEDEEAVDLTQASLEEVMEFIENADDDVVFQIVKKPTYSVTTNSGQGMSDDMGDVSFEDEDEEFEIDENMLREVMGDMEMKMDEAEQVPVYKSGEAIPPTQKGKFGVTDTTGNVKMVQSENRKLKSQLEQIVKENRQLKLNETKSVAALKQMIEKSKQLALVNSNLAYVTRLFTEHATTKQEKMDVLRKFDATRTIEESQKTFKTLNESFSKKTVKKGISVNVNEAKDFNQKQLITEEKAYVDPDQEKLLRLMYGETGL